ncbi:MAG: hypothetical protein AAF358_13545 [Pseudomonadota bacterium]
MTKILDLLAANLRHYMSDREYSQHTMGRMSGVVQKSVSRAVNAEKAAQIDSLDGYAYALKLDTWALLAPKYFQDHTDIIDEFAARYAQADPKTRNIMRENMRMATPDFQRPEKHKPAKKVKLK